MKNTHLYQQLTNLAYTDPMAAGKQFREFLMKGASSPKKRDSAKCQDFLGKLDKIMSGDTESWQYSSKNLTDAIHFILSNFFLGDAGLGVLNVGPREDIALSIAAMVSENIDYAPMTPEQRQLKSIAESLGYSVYLLETDTPQSSTNQVIENTLYARIERWEDPSSRSDFPNRIPSYDYVEYGGKYIFKTNETEEEIELSLDRRNMYDFISQECDIDSGITYQLDFKLEDGICTIWITDAEVDDDYGDDYGNDY